MVVLAMISGCASTAVTHLDIRPVEAPEGRVVLDQGVIEFGDSDDVVDLYIDALCPYCKQYESLHADRLFSEASDGKITLRVHPLAILDRLSAETLSTAHDTRGGTPVKWSTSKSSIALLGDDRW